MPKSGYCALSGKYYPSLDEHHIIPREYGGEDGPTIWLGPDIHQSLHRAVNNPVLKDELISSMPEQNKKYAAYLIKILVDLEKTGTKVNKEGVKVTIKLPQAFYTRLQVEAKSRRLSIPDLILKLLGVN